MTEKKSCLVLDTRFALSDEYMHEYYMSEAKTMVIGMNIVNHVHNRAHTVCWELLQPRKTHVLLSSMCLWL